MKYSKEGIIHIDGCLFLFFAHIIKKKKNRERHNINKRIKFHKRVAPFSRSIFYPLQFLG
jgi:hypothetical protein